MITSPSSLVKARKDVRLIDPRKTSLLSYVTSNSVVDLFAIQGSTFPFGAGLAVGSETAGGVRYINFVNNHLGECAKYGIVSFRVIESNSDSIVRLKGCNQNGGVWENVSFVGIKGDLIDTTIYVRIPIVKFNFSRLSLIRCSAR